MLPVEPIRKRGHFELSSLGNSHRNRRLRGNFDHQLATPQGTFHLGPLQETGGWPGQPPPWQNWNSPFYPNNQGHFHSGFAPLEDTDGPHGPRQNNPFAPNTLSSPAPFAFAPLEDTDRLPRPSDMFHGPFGAPPSMFNPWANGPPAFVDATPFGLPMVHHLPEPIPPMPMHSPFPHSPFPMHPPTQWPFMTPGNPRTHPVLFTEKYPYESDHLAARPSDWRPDYFPPRRFRLFSRLRVTRKCNL
ncbi:hypothetical protein B0H10DRAFT_285700 [Mycena sp. CBHHK59/15]|nr:hypothetical protein B0H10DRAFT_285700 [Mycena sp. CBHHK59/15]